MNHSRRPTVTILLVIVFFLLLWAALSIFIRRTLSDSTPGIDFYVFWSAGRAYFNQQNPYSPEIDRQIFDAIFSDPARAGPDPMEFEYPVYVLFMVAPVLALDFAWAQAIWMSFNILALMTVSYTLYPNGSRAARLFFPFLYPMVFGLILGNFVILIAASLLIFLSFFVEKHPIPLPVQILLGIVLAWSTAKPQFTGLMLLVILLYSLREKLWPFLASFAGALLAMVSLSFVFLPGWPILWLEQLQSYQSYSTIMLQRFLAYIVPDQVLLVSVYSLLVVLMILTIWLVVRWWKDQVDHLFLIAWIGFTTFLVDLSTVAYEQLVFLVPLYLWAARHRPSLGFSLLCFGAWTLSFVFFFLDFYKLIPHASDELPFLLYSIWLGWYAARIYSTTTRLKT